MSDAALQYVNRLSDFLFVAARWANAKGEDDVLVGAGGEPLATTTFSTPPSSHRARASHAPRPRPRVAWTLASRARRFQMRPDDWRAKAIP